MKTEQLVQLAIPVLLFSGLPVLLLLFCLTDSRHTYRHKRQALRTTGLVVSAIGGVLVLLSTGHPGLQALFGVGACVAVLAWNGHLYQNVAPRCRWEVDPKQHCLKCQYPREGINSVRCPECGSAWDDRHDV